MNNQSTMPEISGNVAVRLSPEQAAAVAKAKANMEAQRAERLDALGQSLVKKRKSAIDARSAFGIDQQWKEDLEFYEGIDDANRGEVNGGTSWTTKPPGQIMAPAALRGEVRSTVFVNITRPYCDAASARIGDMLMPTDDRAFSIKPTPVPELVDIAKGNLSQSVKASLLQQVQTQDQLAPAVTSAIDKAKADLQEAKDKAFKAQDRIDDWFVESQYHAEVRKVIEDCSKIGTGILKGPFPVKRKQQAVISKDGVIALEIREEIKPSSRRVDPFNFFPDPACGENMHNGSFVWERDFLTRMQLQDLRDMPGYLGSQIDLILEEGPKQAKPDGINPSDKTEFKTSDRFEVWYYHGVVAKEDIEAAGCKCEESPQSIHAMITMVNERVVKASLNHLDTGEFPYDVMTWQSSSGKWTGIGVSRQIRTPQRMINAASRNMMDNAGLSAGPQIIMKLGVVTPADGNNTLSPRKIWYISHDADINDINQAFRVFNIDSKQAELKAIIDFGLKLAEDVTGLPMLMQGQQGKAPDTLGGMQMLNNNASTVLRRLAKNYDDSITEPHVRRYYVWLMQYGDDSEKGDFQIDARGSSALVERDIQNQAVLQMGSIVTNPVFGVNPKKWFAEYSKSQRLDAKNFQYTEEEEQQIAQSQQQSPSDPRIAVAQIRADLEKQLAQFDDQSKARMLQMEQQFDLQQNERDRQMHIFIAEINNASKESVSLADLKERLANVAIKVKAQRDLSAQSLAVDMHKNASPKVLTPPSEPAGRAIPGQAFQQ